MFEHAELVAGIVSGDSGGGIAGAGTGAQGVDEIELALKCRFRRAYYAIGFHGFQNRISQDEFISGTLFWCIASTPYAFFNPASSGRYCCCCRST